MIEQRLIIKDDYTLTQLEDVIERGGKFVIFQYCYSFFLITFTVMTSSILITEEEELKKYQRRYNRISRLLGWWGIPSGPSETLSCLKINRKGGLDVTKDIMLNLTETGLRNRLVDIVKVNEVFDQPDKWELKAFKKALVKNFETDPQVLQIVVGLQMNKPEEDIQPNYVIGILANEHFHKYAQAFEPALRKEFQKHVQFEFVDLYQPNEQEQLLMEQGLSLLNRSL